MSSQPKPVLDIEGIQRLLPHRPPFLLVDRVVAFEKDTSLTAIKGVTMNEPFFEVPSRPSSSGMAQWSRFSPGVQLPVVVSVPARCAASMRSSSPRRHPRHLKKR